MKVENIPYVKRYDENGQIINPITKENPYPSRTPYKIPVNKEGIIVYETRYYPNRSERRKQGKELYKNRKKSH